MTFRIQAQLVHTTNVGLIAWQCHFSHVQQGKTFLIDSWG
jgi:hypothetical protein